MTSIVLMGCKLNKQQGNCIFKENFNEKANNLLGFITTTGCPNHAPGCHSQCPLVLPNLKQRWRAFCTILEHLLHKLGFKPSNFAFEILCFWIWNLMLHQLSYGGSHLLKQSHWAFWSLLYQFDLQFDKQSPRTLIWILEKGLISHKLDFDKVSSKKKNKKNWGL